MSSRIRQLYEFGPFLLDASERALLRGEETVHLTPKEFETLLALVRGGGRLMSKEELLKEIWPDTFVEEATLAQNIFTLRKALAKGGGEQQYVETVPRRGYRFVAKVHERQEELTAETAADNLFEIPALVGAQAEARRIEAAPELSAGANGQFVQRDGVQSTGRNGHGPAGALASEETFSTPSDVTPAAVAVSSTPRTAPLYPPDSHGHPVRAAILISVVAVLSVSALIYGVFRFVIHPKTELMERPPAFQSMKVTRLPVAGVVDEAVISPDGKYLAYVAEEHGRQSASVWVRQVSAASNMQQIVPPAEATFYGGLVFSPDSQHVYFVSGRDGNPLASLYRVPVLGGATQKILENLNGPVTFAPDGRRMAFVRGDFDHGMTLFIAQADGDGGERQVASRKGPTIFGLPAWSPDGKTIACVYGSVEHLNSSTPYLGVTAFDAADGSERQVTSERWVGISQLAWLPDASGLVMNASEQELSPSQIWQLSYPLGEARRVTNDLNTYYGASLTADASALVTVQTDRVPNVWVAPNGDAARARQITTGTGKFDGYYGVAWTPDGRIVYASVASGSWDIWVMNADGTGQKQLTVGARSNYGPSVSADGRYVVFVSNRAGGAFNVWRMDADGSNPKQLTFGKGENFVHVTPDNRWVVYATVGYGQSNVVWKVPLDGGEAVQLTDRPSSWPFVSPDGKLFVCTYGDGSGATTKLALIPIDGGPPTKLFDTAPSFRANTVWLPDNRGVAYLDSRTGTNNVWMQPLGGGKPVQLTDFKADNVSAYDWSRDRQLVAARSIETTGVVLIRDFR
jgi:Tol biopolymer transport system component/DNA-binding winged helix-turn-helix (wHTH) protein